MAIAKATFRSSAVDPINTHPTIEFVREERCLAAKSSTGDPRRPWSSRGARWGRACGAFGALRDVRLRDTWPGAACGRVNGSYDLLVAPPPPSLRADKQSGPKYFVAARGLRPLIRYLCYAALSEHSRAEMDPTSFYRSRFPITGAEAWLRPGAALIKSRAGK